MDSQTAQPSIVRWLTLQQVAKRFGVAPRTIRRWDATGKIPRGIRVTRSTVRWREDQIESFLASLK